MNIVIFGLGDSIVVPFAESGYVKEFSTNFPL